MSEQTKRKDPKMLNGVNVDSLYDTVDAINNEPGLAAFSFRAKNKWLGGAHNRTCIKDFYGAGQEHTSREEPFYVHADEHQVLLGTDTGPNPVEVLLHALAGCLTTGLVYHAAARGIHLEEVESILEGDIDLHGFLGLSEDVRPGYQGIRVSFRIKGDAPEETLEQLCELAQMRSPVFDVITNRVPVTVSLVN